MKLIQSECYFFQDYGKTSLNTNIFHPTPQNTNHKMKKKNNKRTIKAQNVPETLWKDEFSQLHKN